MPWFTFAHIGQRSRTFVECRESSHPLYETVHHALLAGAVEGDGELVAVDRDHVAVAEFLVEDAVAGGEGGRRAGRFGDQLALDGKRAAAALRGGSEALRSRAGLVGR